MEYWYFGLAIAAFAIFIKVLGINLQKFSHDNNDGSGSYCKSVVWMIGASCTVIGALLDLVALSLAPQSMVASLGGLTLIVNIVVARIMLQETLAKRQYFTTGIILIGTVLTVVYSPKKESIQDIDEIKKMFESINFIIYISLVTIILILIRTYNYFTKGDDTKKGIRGLILPISSGIIAAQNVLFGKSFSKLILFSIENKTASVLKDYVIYLTFACLAFSIFTNIKWFNNILKQFKSTLVVPINKSIWIITSIVGGLLVMDEEIEQLSLVGFLIGIILIVLGLIFHAKFEPKEDFTIDQEIARTIDSVSSSIEIEVMEQNQ